ncbi:MAG: recombinase family protein [Eubacteriales bacterium]|nr:recombinase family protein [Eubacteriales bacterium]
MAAVKQNMTAIYCRLSEEDRGKEAEWEESRSIQNQKEMLVQFAKDRGWEVYGIYSDEAYAGADRKRPAFNRLLEDAQSGVFQIILCKSQSRFTREMELVEKYIHGLFPLWGIRFVSVADHGDTANRGNKKARQINGLVNEWYLEDLSDNIKTVLDNRRRQGYHIGATAVYGYQKDEKQRGHLVVDEEAAEVVRRIFRLYTHGMGKTAIARKLNEEGIVCPAEYKRRQARGCQERKGEAMKQEKQVFWSYGTISRILQNEMYIGTMVQGKFGSESYKTKRNRPRPPSRWYRVENTHEPIVEREMWEKAQAKNMAVGHPASGGRPGVLAHKVFCLTCGHGMRSHKTAGRRYLRCPVRMMKKDACEGAFISVESLERSVYEEIKKQAERYVDAELFWKGQRECCQEQNGDNRERLWIPGGLTREIVDNFIEKIEVGAKNRDTGEILVNIHWKM